VLRAEVEYLVKFSKSIFIINIVNDIHIKKKIFFFSLSNFITHILTQILIHNLTHILTAKPLVERLHDN
jgi:hypothetical protein